MNMVEQECSLRKYNLRFIKRDLRHAYKCARQEFDKMYRRLERQYKRGQMLELENTCKNDPKNFWNHLKKLGPSKNKTIPTEVYDHENEIVTDKERILEKWRSEFCSLYNPVSGEGNRTWLNYIKQQITMFEDIMADPLFKATDSLNHNLTVGEVREAAYKAKNRKAVGIDKLPNEIFKNDHVIKVLTDLFQLCFDTGKIPAIWLQAIILPIPQNTENDPRIPLNYRGISLLSCASKIFTSLLNSRLSAFLDNKEEIVEEQNGFRKQRSCTDHVFTLTSLCKIRQIENKSTFVTYIDFSKAFDCVNREMLFLKLLNSGVDGKMYFIIKALYMGTNSCVKVNNWLTEWFETLMGVRQGDSLSPTLFSVFVNDLAMGIKELGLGIEIDNVKLPILLYADDVALLSDNEQDMQTMLDYVDNWCTTWGMKINMTKSKVMHIRKKGTERSDYGFRIGKKPADYVTEYKYLGVIIDEFLDFTPHSNIMSGAGHRALGGLIGKYKKLNGMGYDTYTKCFKTCVCPVIDYNAEVWGYIKCPKIDAVQNKAMRVYLGVHRFAANAVLTGDMAWCPSIIRRKLAMMRYWNRLIIMDEDRLPKLVFNYEIHKRGKWSEFLEKSLREINMGEFFQSKECIDLKLAETRLLNKYAQQWKEQVGKKPKLRTYRKFKEKFEIENYVTLNLDRHQRSILSQLRSGILPLQVELGRYNNTKLEDRTCTLCTGNVIEDECHLLFHCPMYTNCREEFFSVLPADLPLQNDYELLSSLFALHTQKLAKYVCKIFYMRQKQLFK